MAWTTTKQTQFGTGDVFIQVWEMTADSATIEFDTGLHVLQGAFLSPASMNSAGSKYGINANSTGSSAKGYVAITGCTSGDEMFLLVVGR